MILFIIFYIVEKPNLVNLQSFPMKMGGSTNIITQISSQFRCIGTLLLQDKHGSIVESIYKAALHDPDDTMFRIISRWLKEDTESSWKKLTECLRQCKLATIANEIERSLQLNEEQLEGK